MYTLTPKQMEDEIIACMAVDLVPYITSSPGMGKSSICAQVAKKYRLKLLDFRLSQCTPEDLQGFPMRSGDKATFSPFDIFPLAGEALPDGYDGWLLLLDEMSSAPKLVQAAAYKLILDKMVGSYHLHERVKMVAAGNKADDRAVVVKMSTALQSRMTHYELAIDHKQWMEWAIENDIDYRITGFLNFAPSKLMDFKPDHTDKTFTCPRTWEFLSRLIKGQPVSHAIAPRIAGTIGEGMAVEFITFAEEYTRIPKILDILNDPTGIAIPDEASTKYAVMSMLIEHHTDQNMEAMLKYVIRFDIEMQILFARGVVIRSPKLRSTNKAFGKFTMDMLKYL